MSFRVENYYSQEQIAKWREHAKRNRISPLSFRISADRYLELAVRDKCSVVSNVRTSIRMRMQAFAAEKI